jgi:hypothetical protein
MAYLQGLFKLKKYLLVIPPKNVFPAARLDFAAFWNPPVTEL